MVIRLYEPFATSVFAAPQLAGRFMRTEHPGQMAPLRRVYMGPPG